MTADEVKAVLRRYCEEITSQNKLDVADEIIGESLWSSGPQGVKNLHILMRKSFPDVKREIHDLVVEGEKVVTYTTYTGTHTGGKGLVPYAATGVSSSQPTVATYIVRDGKIVDEVWALYDREKCVIHPIVKGVIKRFLEEVYGQGAIDVVDEIVHQEYVLHGPARGGIRGVDGVKQAVASVRSAFPDLRGTVDDLMADGDRVIARWSASGTHQGDFMGVRRTGRSVSVTGISIYCFRDGQIAEEWMTWDAWGMMQQLGAGPSR